MRLPHFPVKRAFFQQFSVSALRLNAPVPNDNNGIRAGDCRKTVRDDNDGLIGNQTRNRLLNDRLIFRVDIRGGLIQHDNRGILQHCPGDRDPLAFAAGKMRAAADRNPYSWNMDFLEYPDGSGYEARFTKCGICTLMQDLGLYDLTPTMCHLDYTMSEAGGTADFVRRYTLASGGPYCDCGYRQKKQRAK